MTTSLQVSAGGVAVVCCVHDRPKRQITTETEVAELGLTVGQIYDPKQHKIHKCGCCENLFVDPTDIPRFCRVCEGPVEHELRGPLPNPIGEV